VAGPTEILTRAYSRINNLLQLAGSETVNKIDLSAAFPTHDLNPIIQSELVVPFVAQVIHSFAGVGTFQQSLDLYADAGGLMTTFDNIRFGERSFVAALSADWPIPADWDILVTGVAASSLQNQVNNVQFFFRDDYATTTYWPVTAYLSAVVALTGPVYAIVPNATDARYKFYLSPPPWLLTEQSSQYLWVRGVAAGADDFVYDIHGFTAPQGIFPRSLGGNRT